MHNFTEFVARMKAWQVFLLLLVPTVVYQMYFMEQMLTPTDTPGTYQIGDFNKLFRHMLLVTLLMSGLFVAWLLSVGLAANRRM